ncbi:MAG: hypothetical protein K6E19_10135 [Lachnospiraceae bacterium]|nr:hypothetical protein [Lachnospiraceae bacterium]
MRITNKIIQNNSLTNINTNKVLQDKLSNMIATEKKINRPSDDPIIALRSLRLRTSVNQTDQYRTKNAEDAESWLRVTEDAIGTLSDIITDIRKQYVKGSSDPLAVSDRRIIHENLESLAREIYNTGNADFAGRTVFTGYRTDTSLTFQKDSTGLVAYSVSDPNVYENGVFDYPLDTSDVSKRRHMYIISRDDNFSELEAHLADLKYVDENGNATPVTTSETFANRVDAMDYVYAHPDEITYYNDGTDSYVIFGSNVRQSDGSHSSFAYGNPDAVFNIRETKDTVTVDTRSFVHQDKEDETKVTNNDILRVRLSYDKVNATSYPDSTASPDADATFKFAFKTKGGQVFSSYSTAGNATLIQVNTISSTIVTDTTATPPTYCAEDYLLDHPDEVVFIPETGEFLLGKDIGGAGANLAPEDIDELMVDYQKSDWSKGDLRPQHYFTCVDISDPKDPVKYNFESTPDQEICYNIGVNQSLRINTTASECFNHSIVREIEDVLRAIADVEDIEDEISKLEADYAKILDTDQDAKDAKQKEIDAAKKAQTFLNERLHSLFSKGISFADAHLAANSLALTNCGTRSKRLELIENRLDTQLDTLKELKSENEDADMAETAIRLSSAKYAYDASLMATSKAIQQTLLNYL